MEQDIINLLEKAKAGDEDAFNEVYTKYYKSAYIRAYQLCHNEADAKDAVQDAFIQIHHSFHNLRDVSSFYSWMIMIVINKCKNQFKKHRIINSTIRDGETLQLFEENRMYMKPHTYMEVKSDKDVLERMISELPSVLSNVVEMMYFKQMKQSEIAEELNIPLGTVKSRITKAKQELKKNIEAYEQKEGYHLDFKLDAILPMSVMGTIATTLLNTLKTPFTTLANFAAPQATTLMVIASVSVLSISGIAIVNEVNELQNETQQSLTNKPVQGKYNNPYEAIPYQEITIEDNKQAYFTCLNFAQNEIEMKEKKQHDVTTIKPIYEELKKNNSSYYKTLQSLGWEQWYLNQFENNV